MYYSLPQKHIKNYIFSNKSNIHKTVENVEKADPRRAEDIVGVGDCASTAGAADGARRGVAPHERWQAANRW